MFLCSMPKKQPELGILPKRSRRHENGSCVIYQCDPFPISAAQTEKELIHEGYNRNVEHTQYYMPLDSRRYVS